MVFCHIRFFKLVQHWQKCMNHFGDFVEECRTCPGTLDSICFLSCTFVSLYIKCAYYFCYNLHNREERRLALPQLGVRKLEGCRRMPKQASIQCVAS
jgi:hypothetical protein